MVATNHHIVANNITKSGKPKKLGCNFNIITERYPLALTLFTNSIFHYSYALLSVLMVCMLSEDEDKEFLVEHSMTETKPKLHHISCFQ